MRSSGIPGIGGEGVLGWNAEVNRMYIHNIYIHSKGREIVRIKRKVVRTRVQSKLFSYNIHTIK